MADHIEFSEDYTAGHVCLFILQTLTFLAVIIMNCLSWAVVRILNEEDKWLLINMLNTIMCNSCLAMFYLIPTAAYTLDDQWSYGVQLCVTILSLRQFMLTILSWTIFSTLLNRLLYYKLQERYAKFQGNFYVKQIVIIWVLSTVLNIPSFIKMNHINYQGNSETTSFQCVPPNVIFNSFYQMLLSYVIPMTLSVAIYLVISLSTKKISQVEISEDTVKQEPVVEFTTSDIGLPRNYSRPDTPWGNTWRHKIEDKLHDGPNTHLPPIENDPEYIPPATPPASTIMDTIHQSKTLTSHSNASVAVNRNHKAANKKIIAIKAWAVQPNMTDEKAADKDGKRVMDEAMLNDDINIDNSRENNILKVHNKLCKLTTVETDLKYEDAESSFQANDQAEREIMNDEQSDLGGYEDDSVSTEVWALYDAYLTRILCLPIILYTVLCLPLIITYATVTLFKDSTISFLSWLTIQWIADLNLVFNPFLLVLIHCDWRQVLKYVFLIIRHKDVTIPDKDMTIYAIPVSNSEPNNLAHC